MLKIRNNVSLKELEKYGFIQRANLFYKPSSKDKDLIDISIDFETKIVNCTGILGRSEKLDSLYDLIKDDLIEKIDDSTDIRK